MAERLDIIVFGATGFTGKCCLPYVHEFTKTGGNLTWGVAGRNREKLQEVLAEASARIGEDVTGVPIVIADVSDESSIKQMTAQAKVIVNCCGPYELYGEVVVKSCVETKTHHVDVSGENTYIEGMELDYCKAAEDKGIYIVSACGMDSIPSDLGVAFLEKNFKGTLNSVEVYLSGHLEGKPTPGPQVNYGTWASIVNGMGNLSQMLFHKKLNEKPLPELKPKLSFRFPIHRFDSKWALPFPGADRDIILRSQRYFYQREFKRPIQAHCYVAVDSFFVVLKMMFLGILALLAQFNFGRNLLLKYPEFFSGGFFSHKSPSMETVERQHFCFTLRGKGWSENLIEGDDQYKTPPNKVIVGKVRGKNPGYGFTCAAVTLCAIMILTEPEKLPPKGGVYTTAAAFSKTSLVEQLQKSGTVFEIISEGDL